MTRWSPSRPFFSFCAPPFEFTFLLSHVQQLFCLLTGLPLTSNQPVYSCHNKLSKLPFRWWHSQILIASNTSIFFHCPVNEGPDIPTNQDTPSLLNVLNLFLLFMVCLCHPLACRYPTPSLAVQERRPSSGILPRLVLPSLNLSQGQPRCHLSHEGL